MSALEDLRALLPGPFAGFALTRVTPGVPAEIDLSRGIEVVTLRLFPATEARVYRRTRRFGVAYRRAEGARIELAPVDAFVAALLLVEGSIDDALLVPHKEHPLETLRAVHRAKTDRPLRVVLVNLCEETSGYGPGASEYLRAKLLSIPELERQLEVTLLFLGGVDSDAFAEQIAAQEPDLVGFTCYSWNLEATAKTTRALRRLCAPIVVWGGCSFALLRERSDWFAWWGDVDAVAIGSGEQTIVDLVSRLLERGPGRGLGDAPIRGAITNVDGRLVDGGPAVVPRSLLEVPSPYVRGTAFRVARPYVEMARGCKFQCTFCSDARASRENLWLPTTRARIAEDVAAIVAWPEAREIDAGASTANVAEEHFADVCAGIRAGDPEQRLSYSLQMYPAIVRPSQRRALEGVRVKRIGIGVQSSTPETWGPMRRKSTLEHIRRSADILRGVGPLYITVLLGLPGETYDSFVGMLDELLGIEEVSLAVHRLLVLPGTQLHARHEQFGLTFDPATFYRVQSSDRMSNADLRRAQDVVRARSEAQGVTSTGERRIDWTNFDDQSFAFDGAPMPRSAVASTAR